MGGEKERKEEGESRCFGRENIIRAAAGCLLGRRGGEEGRSQQR